MAYQPQQRRLAAFVEDVRFEFVTEVAQRGEHWPWCAAPGRTTSYWPCRRISSIKAISSSPSPMVMRFNTSNMRLPPIRRARTYRMIQPWQC